MLRIIRPEKMSKRRPPVSAQIVAQMSLAPTVPFMVRKTQMSKRSHHSRVTGHIHEAKSRTPAAVQPARDIHRQLFGSVNSLSLSLDVIKVSGLVPTPESPGIL